MSDYPGQGLSIEQLFHAVNLKILERTQLHRSSVPEPDQERWISNVHKQLCKTVANANFLKNSIRPFHRLHPDIIVEISEYLDPRACSDKYEPLLCASQICRTWRDALVSQPSLWSFIDGSRPYLIPYLLERSKSAQLDVYIVSDRSEMVIAFINPHTDRLRSLHFELNDSIQFAVLRRLNPAPRLCHLEIDSRYPFFRHPEFTPGIARPTASVHHLQLTAFPITSQLLQLRHLTVVSLDVSSATWRTLFNLLSGNPLLKVIHLGGYPEVFDSGDHPPGSIILPHLEVLSSEKIPLHQFEALSPPHGVRMFSGFIRGGRSNHHASGSSIVSLSLPPSFSNLQDLQKLRLVDEGEVYVKLEGDGGSLTYRVSRDRASDAGTFRGPRLEQVTDAIYEISPLFWQSHVISATSQPMVSHITCALVRLQRLELSCLDAEQVDYFLLVLHSINVCRDLRLLVLSHCVELYRRMGNIVTMAEGRKAAGIGLDSIRIVHSNVESLKVTFKQEHVTKLERAVGTFEYLQAKQGHSGQSSLRFDPEIGFAQPSMFL